MPAKSKYVEVASKPKFAAGTAVKFPQAAQAAQPTQANAIGNVKYCHRFVRTGWTNFMGKNMEIAKRETIPRIIQ